VIFNSLIKNRKVLIGVFLIYTFYVLWITLLMRINIVCIDTSCNFIPFDTIITFTKRLYYNNNYWTRKDFIENIAGNLLLLTPHSFFIQTLFAKYRIKAWRFLTITLLVIFIIESLQFVFQLGQFDVDDFLLNISGAMMGYWLVGRFGDWHENY